MAARTLRRSGFDGRLVVIGEETERPYQRPPLSKEYLESGDGSALELLPESWTEQQSVEVRTGVRATKISARDGGVLLDDGSFVAADAVLLATGARARRLAVAGGRGRLLPAQPLPTPTPCVIGSCPVAGWSMVGGGFIGAELASTARSRGAEVTLLEAGPVPLAQAVGTRLGEACARLQRAAGVDVRVDSAVQGVRREAGGSVVSTTRGDVEADVVVVGIGAVPNQEIAVDSGIDVDNGVLVDEYCRTSLEHVFAAGDVAHHHHPGSDAGCASSTSTTPAGRPPSRHATCWASRRRTTNRTGSGPTSSATTCSTSGTPRPVTGWWSAATSRRQLVGVLPGR